MRPPIRSALRFAAGCAGGSLCSPGRAARSKPNRIGWCQQRAQHGANPAPCRAGEAATPPPTKLGGAAPPLRFTPGEGGQRKVSRGKVKGSGSNHPRQLRTASGALRSSAERSSAHPFGAALRTAPRGSARLPPHPAVRATLASIPRSRPRARREPVNNRSAGPRRAACYPHSRDGAEGQRVRTQRGQRPLTERRKLRSQREPEARAQPTRPRQRVERGQRLLHPPSPHHGQRCKRAARAPRCP